MALVAGAGLILVCRYLLVPIERTLGRRQNRYLSRVAIPALVFSLAFSAVYVFRNVFDKELVPLRTKRAELTANPALVTRALAEGAEKARSIARTTMHEVRKAMGLGGSSS